MGKHAPRLFFHRGNRFNHIFRARSLARTIVGRLATHDGWSCWWLWCWMAWRAGDCGIIGTVVKPCGQMHRLGCSRIPICIISWRPGDACPAESRNLSLYNLLRFVGRSRVYFPLGFTLSVKNINGSKAMTFQIDGYTFKHDQNFGGPSTSLFSNHAKGFYSENWAPLNSHGLSSNLPLKHHFGLICWEPPSPHRGPSWSCPGPSRSLGLWQCGLGAQSGGDWIGQKMFGGWCWC